jgi:hypothetical protein
MGGPPGGRPGLQRRVLPDGRIVTVVDDPNRTGDPDDGDDGAPPGNQPGMMRQPGNMLPRQPGQAGGDEPQSDTPPGQQVTPATSAAPVAPSVTVSTPGALPATKPGALPPPPIKPPGD